MFKRIFGVHVNIDAFKDFKTLDALKKEPGKIFEHLGSKSDNAYAELFDAISPKKEVKQTQAPVPAPAVKVDVTEAKAE